MDFFNGIFWLAIGAAMLIILFHTFSGSRSKTKSPSSDSEADAEKQLWDVPDDEPLNLQPYQVRGSHNRSKDQR